MRASPSSRCRRCRSSQPRRALLDAARHPLREQPVLGIVDRLQLHGTVLTVATDYVGVLAAAILLIATNAGLIGISRLSWSLAEHRQLPGLFARLHPRYRTPWFTIVVFSVLAVLLILPGQTNLLGNLYAFGAMLSFTTAHVAIVALRVKQPDVERPYRIRGNDPLARRPDPDLGAGRRSRHLRRLDLRRRPPQRGAADRPAVDGARRRRLLPLPHAPGARPARAPPDRAHRTPARLHAARLPDGARPDLRRRRQRAHARRARRS